MKLGTDTGSLINHIQANNVLTTPEVGMGATILGWTDRHACTIVAVHLAGKRIAVTRDIAHRVDKNGMSEVQEYEYTTNPEAAWQYFTLRKGGEYIAQGSRSGSRLSIGRRSHYHDFSF